jgi:hypothetical protein
MQLNLAESSDLERTDHGAIGIKHSTRPRSQGYNRPRPTFQHQLLQHMGAESQGSQQVQALEHLAPSDQHLAP